MSEDEFTGIFEHLEPEDFARETSAIDERVGAYQGAEAFNQFTEENLTAVRVAFRTGSGHMNPFAVLSGGALRRTFTPEDDETLGAFLKRLANEARPMGATWLFFCKKAYYGTYEDTETRDVTDSVGVEKARQAGNWKLGVLWYAERREGGQVERRHGALPILDEERLGQDEPGDPSQTYSIFSTILDWAKK